MTPKLPRSPHRATGPEMTLYVGPNQQKIVIAASILTDTSGWFARAARDGANLFRFEGEDLQEMNLFLDFLEKGRYDLPREDSTPTRNFQGNRIGTTYAKLASKFVACRFHMHRRHVKMYFLGERFDVPALCTYAFEMLFELLEEEDATTIWKWEASETFIEERLRLIIMVYRNPKLYGKPLRKLFALKAAETWSLYMECLEINKEFKQKVALADLTTTAPEFIHDILAYLKDSRNTLSNLGKDGFFDLVKLQV